MRPEFQKKGSKYEILLSTKCSIKSDIGKEKKNKSVSTFAVVWVQLILLLPVPPRRSAMLDSLFNQSSNHRPPHNKPRQFFGPYFFPVTENPSYETRTRVLHKVNGICLLRVCFHNEFPYHWVVF